MRLTPLYPTPKVHLRPSWLYPCEPKSFFVRKKMRKFLFPIYKEKIYEIQQPKKKKFNAIWIVVIFGIIAILCKLSVIYIDRMYPT
jgi:hypothetical protein